MPNVKLEEPLQVAKAFEWTAAGIDFADALHLASSPEAGRFVTFDIKLAKRAKKLELVRVAAL
jgi:predicted nucleic acid-binding protein